MTAHEPRPPDAGQLLRQARRLRFRADPRALAELAGAYHSARPGTGLAFAELRPYEPGDDVRHIDWNVTARQQRPYVRHYTEERALTLWLLLDLSGSMRFGAAGRSKADRASQAAALLASAAIQNGDRVGLGLIGEGIEDELSPRGGVRHLSRLLRLLVAGTTSTRQAILDLVPARFTRRFRRALLVVLSDFRGPVTPAAWRRLSRRHQVLAFRIVDPLEEALPRVGLLEAIDPESGATRILDTLAPAVRTWYAEQAERRSREFESFLRESGIAGRTLRTDQDPLRPLQAFLREMIPRGTSSRAGHRR